MTPDPRWNGMPRVMAAAAVKAGRNVLAVHCRQKDGAQAIDVGLVRVQHP